MQAHREGPNPLRPYYVPPSIGTATDGHLGGAASTPKSNATSTGFSFPDIDYTDYLGDASPSVTGSVRSYLDQALWKYASVLMAQPFEVAKIILQVHVARDTDDGGDLGAEGTLISDPPETASYNDEYANSSDDEPNYFTSTTPLNGESSPSRGRRRLSPQLRSSGASSKTHGIQPDASANRIHLKNPTSLIDALSALSSNSGALALWRATNSTFIYSILARTFEAFFRSFLGAVFGIAEADILVPTSSGAIPNVAILTSASPAATIAMATAATAVSALLLAPIDAARTRLILTPASLEPRTLLATLRTLSPSYLIPVHLIPITFFTSTIPTAISTSTPLLLRSYLNLDPVLNPNSWSIFTFLGSALDLSVRFPLETILRRAQIATWTSPSLAPPSSSSKRKAIETIVPVPQSYRGILPTMWSIMREEGYSESQKDRLAAAAGKAPRRRRKGQGVQGLYHGWRVGLWGLVGVWGASFVGGLQVNADMPAETPSTHGGKF